MRLRRKLGLVALSILAAACGLGPFGEDEVEDHRFLVDLRNRALTPVTIGIAGEPSGFEVQGLSTTTIQRQGDPGGDLVFEARSETTSPRTAACRYHPPSERSPRRVVQWNGAIIDCLHWE